MTGIPNHRPGCTATSIPMNCRCCRQFVILHKCSCGSAVFLAPPDGGKHQCADFPDWNEPPIDPRGMNCIISVRVKPRMRPCGKGRRRRRFVL